LFHEIVCWQCRCNIFDCYEVRSSVSVTGSIDFGDGTQASFSYSWHVDQCPNIPDPEKGEEYYFGATAKRFPFSHVYTRPGVYTGWLDVVYSGTYDFCLFGNNGPHGCDNYPLTTETIGFGNQAPVPFTVTVTTMTPFIDHLSPMAGAIGIPVTITGQAFGTSGTVKFDATPATVTSWSDTQIVVQAPNVPAEVYDVTVTTSAGQSNAVQFKIIGCKEMIENQVKSAIEVNAGIMNARFIPASGLTLAEASKACNVNHFNWHQVITNITLPNLETTLEQAVKDSPTLSPTVVKTVVSTAAALLNTRGTGVDPLLGGNPSSRLRCLGLTTSDQYPFYWDEERPACPFYDENLLVKSQTSNTQLDISDIPNLLVKGTQIVFRTCLAGVKDDFTGLFWPSFEGICFGWTYTQANWGWGNSIGLGGCLDNVTNCLTVQNIDPQLGGTGNATFLGFWQPEDFNRDLIARIAADGFTLGDNFHPSIAGDLDGNGVVDQNDLNILLRDISKNVEQSVCGFQCDLDGDGVITSLDAQKLQLIYNQPPVAKVGPDQTVNEGDPVTLDGSGSNDPQGLSLQYSWTQVSGPSVTLDLSDPILPTFLAPAVSASGATLRFQLVVSDGQLSSTPATVNITVKHANHPPVASVGPDQSVAEFSLVTLDGSASYDPDADLLTYLWSQTGGPTVSLSNPNVAKPTFLAPFVDPTGATLSFQLTVTDTSDSSARATTRVNVTNVNHPPIANAGPDQTVNTGTKVQLDGTASSDPDGDPLNFTWSVLSGPHVTLSDVHSATPSFIGPQVTSPTILTFQLLVDDGFSGMASADVRITLLPVDAPPICTQAVARPTRLWPPDHKLSGVKIAGVTDPDNQKIKLTVTHVTQDEPVGCIARRGRWDYNEDDDESRWCRHTTPDAIIYPNGHVSLRAERREHGNGRVYQITFQADDGQGGQCTGQVPVCVPHDRHDRGCVDDGQVYDSRSDRRPKSEIKTPSPRPGR
jgi:hypothetical protein